MTHRNSHLSDGARLVSVHTHTHISISIYIYIYIHTHMFVCMYTQAEHRAERSSPEAPPALLVVLILSRSILAGIIPNRMTHRHAQLSDGAGLVGVGAADLVHVV